MTYIHLHQWFTEFFILKIIKNFRILKNTSFNVVTSMFTILEFKTNFLNLYSFKKIKNDGIRAS